MAGPSDTLPCGSPGLRDWKGDRRGSSPDTGALFPGGGTTGLWSPHLGPSRLVCQEAPSPEEPSPRLSEHRGPRASVCATRSAPVQQQGQPTRPGVGRSRQGRQQLPPSPQNQKPLRYLLPTARRDRKWKHVHLLYLVQPLFSRQTGKSWPSPLHISPNRAGPAGP